MNTVETLFFVLFVLVSLFLLWKLYSAATETYIEATEGIRDVRAKGKEICDRAEAFLGNEDNRKKLKQAAVDILAAGISHGLQEAHRRITKKELENSRRSRNLERVS